jgi:tetrathionate reductase subunit B
VELGTYPDTRRAFLPRLCNHCERPSCVEVCPAGATWQRQDGVVEIDYDLCIGCAACVNACPYDARFIDPTTNTANKCTFCSQRIDQGLLPACVETCIGGARQFCDLNDPNDPVTKQILTEEVQQLLPATGNEPRVFYIGLTTELQNNPPGNPTLWSVERADTDRPTGDWNIAISPEASHV